VDASNTASNKKLASSQNTRKEIHNRRTKFRHPNQGYNFIDLLWIIFFSFVAAWILSFFERRHSVEEIFTGVVAGTIISALLLGYIARIVRSVLKNRKDKETD